MAHIVGAINPTSDLSHNERVRAMQATPLVGNLYGFSAMFNAMKDTPAERRAAKKAEHLSKADPLSKEAIDAKVQETFNKVYGDTTKGDSTVDRVFDNLLDN
jgi:hypothetical protein